MLQCVAHELPIKRYQSPAVDSLLLGPFILVPSSPASHIPSAARSASASASFSLQVFPRRVSARLLTDADLRGRRELAVITPPE
jgi:hypothetical protein